MFCFCLYLFLNFEKMFTQNSNKKKENGCVFPSPKDINQHGCFQKQWVKPKLDGENNGKAHESMDDFGVPLFLETPKSSILIGFFPYFHHPFWGTPILGNTHINQHLTNHLFFVFPPRVVSVDRSLSSLPVDLIIAHVDDTWPQGEVTETSKALYNWIGIRCITDNLGVF